MNACDYIVTLEISERGLAEGKRPPLCDGCGSSIPKNQDDDTYAIHALILDGERFHGVECEECIKRYFANLHKFEEKRVPKQVRQAIRLELAQEMQVVFY